MNILLLDPFLGGSHKVWAEGWQQNSTHNITILGLTGSHWKWRMHGGAVKLAQQFLDSDLQPDVIMATDMLDLTTFLSLTRRRTANIPTAIYFHENQLTYPWSPQDRDVEKKRDNHYSFINYTSALAADKVYFNSAYHKDSFLEELPRFLKMFPDHKGMNTVEEIKKKSDVLYLGMDLTRLDELKPEKIEPLNRALLLWNHRWEYDKNPEDFFQALFEIQDRGIDFKLAVLGESYEMYPSIFDEAKEKLGEKIVHWGYAADKAEYAKWLWLADILPVTCEQDFFGGSVVEAMYCNVKPLLPNRLAYPEHVEEKYHSVFFYEGQEQFIKKLHKRIWDVSLLRKQQTRSYIQHYDWGTQAALYDAEMEKLRG